MSDPVTRQEQLLSAIATGGDIISPITREEMYLAYMAGDTSVVLPEPITRKEQFLYQACLNGGGGGGTEITDGIVVKARDASGYATEIDVYGELFDAEFAYRSNKFDQQSGWNRLKIINLKTLTKIPFACFSWLTNLETITGAENVTEIVGSEQAGTMQGAGLLNCSFPNAIYNGGSGRVFKDCPNLETIYLPKVNGVLSGGFFIIQDCPSLKTVELGSIANGVEIGTYAFQNCTQTGLTITIYSASNKADSNLSAIRNYATNATIIIKDSTTGETIVTSTP